MDEKINFIVYSYNAHKDYNYICENIKKMILCNIFQTKIKSYLTLSIDAV